MAGILILSNATLNATNVINVTNVTITTTLAGFLAAVNETANITQTLAPAFANIAITTGNATANAATTEGGAGDNDQVLVWVASSIGSFLGFLLIVGLVILVAKWYGARALGRSIEVGITTCDEHYLGVNVRIEGLKVDGFEGIIAIDSLEVENPPKHYYSPYFVKVGKVVLDLGMIETMKSMGKKVVIDRVILKGVDIIYETKFTTSNLQEILDHLQGEHHSQQEGGVHPAEEEAAKSKQSFFQRMTGACRRNPPPEGKDGEAPAPEAASKKKESEPLLKTEKDEKGVKGKPHEEDKLEIVVREVSLEDIGVKVAMHALRGAGSYTAVADINFKDLDKETKDMDTAAGVSMVLSLILKSVAKSAIATVMGKKVADEKF